MDIALLLIDVQSYFQPPDPVLARLERLLMFADMVGMRVIATCEQPIGEKGELPARLRDVFPADTQVFVKSFFDCMADDNIRDAIEDLECTRVAVAGAETDVCVLQSVLSLLAAGCHEVHLLEDCLFTTAANPEPAIARMRAAGAIPSTFKSLAYEITRTVDRSLWPDGWRQELFPPPEDVSRS